MATIADGEIRVRGLSAGLDASKLRPLFKKYGKITSLNVNADGTAYVLKY